MPPTEPAQHAIDRLRRSADKARGIGMRVSVSGSDLAALLAAHDTARVAALEAEGARPKRPQKRRTRRDNEPVTLAVVSAADDILRDHPALWGQPLAAAIAVWLADTDNTLPEGWEDVVNPDD